MCQVYGVHVYAVHVAFWLEYGFLVNHFQKGYNHIQLSIKIQNVNTKENIISKQLTLNVSGHLKTLPSQPTNVAEEVSGSPLLIETIHVSSTTPEP